MVIRRNDTPEFKKWFNKFVEEDQSNGDSVDDLLLAFTARDKEIAAKDKALEIFTMFLTNTNTITEEAQSELVRSLRLAGNIDFADAIAISGFASAAEVME